MSDNRPGFVSIGDCTICGGTDMELFHTPQGLACVTCRKSIGREAVQKRTAEGQVKTDKFIRDMLEGHDGH